MNQFANANIYTMYVALLYMIMHTNVTSLLSIDLSLPTNGSIDRDSPSWQTNLLDLYIDTINVFNKYPNVLAYNIGNEVVISSNETGTAPFLKAAARDVKAYL